MKKPKRVIKILLITIFSAMGAIVLGIVCIFAFFDRVSPIVNTPLGEYTSGDGKHTISVYLSEAGATTPWTVVAQVQGSGILIKKTIYAKDNIQEAAVKWLDERTVRINGVSLDIYDDKYIDHGD